MSYKIQKSEQRVVGVACVLLRLNEEFVGPAPQLRDGGCHSLRALPLCPLFLAPKSLAQGRTHGQPSVRGAEGRLRVAPVPICLARYSPPDPRGCPALWGREGTSDSSPPRIRHRFDTSPLTP